MVRGDKYSPLLRFPSAPKLVIPVRGERALGSFVSSLKQGKRGMSMVWARIALVLACARLLSAEAWAVVTGESKYVRRRWGHQGIDCYRNSLLVGQITPSTVEVSFRHSGFPL